ncbi:MAG: hypothetical protein JO053_01345 [Acidobacteria bacterium]|nr:hypothetical protein [Acidobacteriota bacterium]
MGQENTNDRSQSTDENLNDGPTSTANVTSAAAGASSTTEAFGGSSGGPGGSQSTKPNDGVDSTSGGSSDLPDGS